MSPEAIAAAYRWACTLDVEVAKPGNVSRAWPGHGMTADDFLRSAAASAPAMATPGRAVGARIEAAVEATWATVACNTNLGIVLLCAPLARAAEVLDEFRSEGSADAVAEAWRRRASALQAAVNRLLEGLDLDDARHAFRAIARARPAGLGQAAEADVNEAARIDLLAAMRLASGRDLVARQYDTAFAECFERALPTWCAAARAAPAHRCVAASVEATDGRGDPPEAGAAAAMLASYLGWLARHPDSHIVRKRGEVAAQSVTREARCFEAAWPILGAEALAGWDASLKHRGLNPGTSADLSVATAFIAALCGAPATVLAAPG